MTRSGYFIRLALSVVIDLFDLTLGRIPVFGTVTEGVGTIVLVGLWGPAGLVNLWNWLTSPTRPTALSRPRPWSRFM